MREVLANFKAKFIAFLKTYRVSILINLIIVVLSVTQSALHISATLRFGPDLNDFSSYYYAAKVLVENPSQLYEGSWLTLTQNGMIYNISPFRYFPTMLLLFFYPFTALPHTAAYIVFVIISHFLNLVNIILVWEIAQKVVKKLDAKFLGLLTAGYFLFAFNVDFFIQGQVTCLMTFFLLLSLYCFLQAREALGGIFLGISLMIKPITFLQIIFVIFAAIRAKDFKTTLKRALWIVIPLIPDLMWFLFKPGYLQGFLRVNNFVGSAHTDPWWSNSFSNFFVSVLHADFNGTFIVCLVSSVAVGCVILWKLQNARDRILFSFIYGIIAYFLTSIDVWNHQLPMLFPFLILGAAYFTTQKSQKQLLFLYVLYPCAAELLFLMIFNSYWIVPIITIISWSFLLLAILLTRTFYQVAIKNVESHNENKHEVIAHANNT